MTDFDPKALEAALQFNRIVDQVEARCMAVDGPVTPTLQEISEQELSDLWHAVQTIRAALPPSPAVVSGWKLVPVEPTEAMTKAGFGPFLAAHDPFFNKNEPTAPIYRAMLAASPSPPALDGAGRDGIVRECASIAHKAHLTYAELRDSHRRDTLDWNRADASCEAAAAVWHAIGDLLPKEANGGGQP
jgi:hypothetical protein